MSELLHHLVARLMCLLYESFLVVKSQDLVGFLCLPMNVLDSNLKGFVDSYGFEVDMLQVDV